LNGAIGEPVFRRGSDWRCAYAGRAILQRAVKRDDRGLGAVIGFAVAAQSSKQTAEGAASSEVAQQVKLIAVDLAIVRRSMGQLAANQDQFAAKQEQMNQNIATLRQAEQEVRQQVLAPPAPNAAHPPAPAAHNPPQPSPR
jgi:adenosylmethionine-8-amino-7-oxononanoate aminotransferase